LGIYTIVNLFLIAIWWFTGGPRVIPWFIFILFGWGIGLASHLLSVYRGEGFIDKMAERVRETKEARGLAGQTNFIRFHTK